MMPENATAIMTWISDRTSGVFGAYEVESETKNVIIETRKIEAGIAIAVKKMMG